MCLGEIGRVRDRTDRNALSIELGGREVTVSAMLLDAVPEVGDWVLVHAGFVLGTLTDPEARAALQMRQATGR